MPLSSDLDRATSPGCGSLWPAARSARIERVSCRRGACVNGRRVAGRRCVPRDPGRGIHGSGPGRDADDHPGPRRVHELVLRAPFHEPSATAPQPPPGTWLVQRGATPGWRRNATRCGPGVCGHAEPPSRDQLLVRRPRRHRLRRRGRLGVRKCLPGPEGPRQDLRR